MLTHQIERLHVPDPIVERGRALNVGKQYCHPLAEGMLTRRIQRVKAFDDCSAASAHIVPLHGEQARFARMKKQINDLGFIASMIGRILDRIDAHDLIVGRLAHRCPKLLNQIVMVRITRAESVESLLKTLFTDGGSEIIHCHNSSSSALASFRSAVSKPSVNQL